MDLFNTVTLIRHNGYITGLVLVDGESYEITPVENGEHMIAKIDQSKFPQGQDTLIPPYNRAEWESNLPPLALNTAPSTIRVIVPVTRQVATVVQDVPGLVALAFTLANQGAVNSNAPVSFVNTSIVYTGYNEDLSPTYQNLLERVGNVNDPVLGGPVNTRRVAERAHLIAMLVDRRNFCGMAWMPASNVSWGSSITTHTCVSGHTFTHELGHNLDLDP